MTFPVHFIICNLYLSLFLGILLVCKRFFRHHLTSHAQYFLWYIFLFALCLPFLPSEIQFGTIPKIWHSSASSAFEEFSSPISLSAKIPLTDHSFVSVSSDPQIDLFLWGIWIAGILFCLLLFFLSLIQTHRLRKQAYPITHQTESELYEQFCSCVEELSITRTIRLYASCHLTSPISYGLLRPTIIIPQDLDIALNKTELRFIFLHELVHYKRKDMLLNLFTCLAQIIYWLNPWISYGFRCLRTDREIACDHSVIQVIGKNQARDYGKTLIRYAGQMQKGSLLSPISRMAGSKASIRKRILKIANYQADSNRQKGASAIILFLVILLVWQISPLLTTSYASDSLIQKPSGEMTTIVDLSSYFQDQTGTFVLYDMTDDHYQIYQEEQSTRRVSPDSTFKIYSGLFSLEEQIITPDSSSQTWDGTAQPFAIWEQDQSLQTAMKNSVNWYFQDLDQQMGLSRLSDYYRTISYGNLDLSGGIRQYWAESSLKISALEQTQLLSDLLNNKWNFKEENIEAIKQAMYLTDLSTGKLYGKTGSGVIDGKKANGWFVGFLIQGTRTYCFATNLQNGESADGASAMEITQKILQDHPDLDF